MAFPTMTTSGAGVRFEGLYPSLYAIPIAFSSSDIGGYTFLSEPVTV